jgi:hypothetical protein
VIYSLAIAIELNKCDRFFNNDRPIDPDKRDRDLMLFQAIEWNCLTRSIKYYTLACLLSRSTNFNIVGILWRPSILSIDFFASASLIPAAVTYNGR